MVVAVNVTLSFLANRGFVFTVVKNVDATNDAMKKVLVAIIPPSKVIS